MLTNLIFILIAFILLFVLYLAVKAITRGVEAKNDLKSENEILEDNSSNLSSEIIKIKKLYDEGILSDEEYKKAKDKVLKNN
tara:strand:- start:643 stop:888 length:246 start_codon:yes stop_codon:yes gene_type:complete